MTQGHAHKGEDAQGIDAFLISGNSLYPFYEADRASIVTGQSRECPYRAQRQEVRTQIPLPIAEAMVTKGGYNYCWDSCTITDCPAYRMEKEGGKK